MPTRNESGDWSGGTGEPPRHALVTAVAKIGAALDEVAELDPTFVPTDQKRTLLLDLHRQAERLHGLLLATLATAGDVAEVDGARNLTGWITARTRTDYGANHAAARLAACLDGSWRQVQAGLRDGRVNTAQAKVLVHALDTVAASPEVDADLLTKAEAHLVEQCALSGPRQLRRLGRKVLEVIAPEKYDDEERRRLEAEEHAADAATSLTVTRRGDGITDLKLRLPDASAARLLGFLDAFTAPRRAAFGPGQTDETTGKRVPTARLRGQGFCALLEHLDPDRLPRHGGRATTLVITISLDQLRDQTGVAEVLGTGETVTAGQARRLACNAGLVPAVLGGPSTPLDLGRTSRLFSADQHLAMAVRDRTCRAEGCSMPAPWCEAHHYGTPWSRGGRTDVKDGKLLCPWHHHRAHDDRYLHAELPNGDIRFHLRR